MFLIGVFYLTFFVSKSKKKNYSPYALLWFLFPFVLNLANHYFVHSLLLSQITLTFGVFATLNLFLSSAFSFYLFWFSSILVLFFQFKYFWVNNSPVGFETLLLVKLFELFNVNAIIDGKILSFKNNIVSVNFCFSLLCAYFTFIFILFASFLKNLKLNFSLLLKFVGSLAAAILLNLFKIFILIYLMVNNFSLSFDRIDIILTVLIIFLASFLFCFITRGVNYTPIDKKPFNIPYLIFLIASIALLFPVWV